MRRILVVDDDLHTRLAIRAWLKRYGFRVAIADGGTNGLAALDEASFDLMIVDIFMPQMRGFESIRIFHQRAPTVPLIAISGYAFSGPKPTIRSASRWLAAWAPRGACANRSGRQLCSTSSTNACPRLGRIEDTLQRLPVSRALHRSRRRRHYYWGSRTGGPAGAELNGIRVRYFRTFVGNGAVGCQEFLLEQGFLLEEIFCLKSFFI